MKILKRNKPMGRNEHAACNNCPYYMLVRTDAVWNECRLNSIPVMKKPTEWCSHHPEFEGPDERLMTAMRLLEDAMEYVQESKNESRSDTRIIIALSWLSSYRMLRDKTKDCVKEENKDV